LAATEEREKTLRDREVKVDIAERTLAAGQQHWPPLAGQRL
jgi:hypothetical protein